jgi:hypothetical protein
MLPLAMSMPIAYSAQPGQPGSPVPDDDEEQLPETDRAPRGLLPCRP